MHDAPLISKPASGVGKSKLGEAMSDVASAGVFRYLRLRLPLEEGMIVVSPFLPLSLLDLPTEIRNTDDRARHLLFPSPSGPHLCLQIS